MTQTFPGPITTAMVTPVWVRTIATSGGVKGDGETATATFIYATGTGGSEATTYVPKTPAEMRAIPGAPPEATPIDPGEVHPDYTLAPSITRPEGWIAPNQPASAVLCCANPTITSLAPNTIAAGTPSPLTVVVTGTNFTQWSTLETGGVPSPYVQYNSATKLTILMDPARSTPGIVVVKVVDHNVKSAGTNFTFT